MIANRLIKNFLSLSAAGVVHSVVAVVSTIYLARILGPEGFGRVSFAFTIVQFFLILSAMGLDTIGVREVAKNKERVKDYVKKILSLKLSLAIVLFLILIAITPVFNRPADTNKLLFLYGLVLFPSALFLEWTWQGLERMGNIGISKIIRQTLYLSLLFIFVKDSKHIDLVPIVFLMVNIFYALMLYVIFFKNYGGINLTFNIKESGRLLTESTPIGISQLLAVMVYSLNTVLIGFLVSDEGVGYYNAAFQVVSSVLIFLAIFFDSIFPTISNLYHTSITKMERILSFSGKILLMVTFPIAIIGTILSKQIMHLLYGSKYDNGIIVLQLLIWTSILVAINSIYARGLLAAGMQNFFLKIVIVMVAVNLSLNLLLLPLIGVAGATISTISAEIVGFFFYYRGFKNVGTVNISDVIAKILAASLVMSIFLLVFINITKPLFLISGGLAIYVTAIYFLKCIDYDEFIWAKERILGSRGNAIKKTD